MTKDELQTAMSYLKDQLGEDELRLLLERLDAYNDDTKLDVTQLMQLANKDPAAFADQAGNRPLISSTAKYILLSRST